VRVDPSLTAVGTGVRASRFSQDGRSQTPSRQSSVGARDLGGGNSNRAATAGPSPTGPGLSAVFSTSAGAAGSGMAQTDAGQTQPSNPAASIVVLNFGSYELRYGFADWPQPRKRRMVAAVRVSKPKSMQLYHKAQNILRTPVFQRLPPATIFPSHHDPNVDVLTQEEFEALTRHELECEIAKLRGELSSSDLDDEDEVTWDPELSPMEQFILGSKQCYDAVMELSRSRESLAVTLMHKTRKAFTAGLQRASSNALAMEIHTRSGETSARDSSNGDVAPPAWTQEEQLYRPPDDVSVVTGEAALTIAPSEPFVVTSPFRRGMIRTSFSAFATQSFDGITLDDALQQPEPSTHRSMELLTKIVHDALEDLFGAKPDPQRCEQYSVVAVLPDAWPLTDVELIVRMLLSHFGFRELSLGRESPCACFGSGVTSGCIVDIGDQKTTITCLLDGHIVYNSVVYLAYGASDVTSVLRWLLHRECAKSSGVSSSSSSSGKPPRAQTPFLSMSPVTSGLALAQMTQAREKVCRCLPDQLTIDQSGRKNAAKDRSWCFVDWDEVKDEASSSSSSSEKGTGSEVTTHFVRKEYVVDIGAAAYVAPMVFFNPGLLHPLTTFYSYPCFRSWVANESISKNPLYNRGVPYLIFAGPQQITMLQQLVKPQVQAPTPHGQQASAPAVTSAGSSTATPAPTTGSPGTDTGTGTGTGTGTEAAAQQGSTATPDAPREVVDLDTLWNNWKIHWGSTHLPLHRAIGKSILNVPAGSGGRDKLGMQVFLVGGGSKILGLDDLLEEQLLEWLPLKDASLRNLRVTRDARMDPSTASWRGAAILFSGETACLTSYYLNKPLGHKPPVHAFPASADSAVWITRLDWEVYGWPMLQDRLMWR